jgi:hypothetical protein
MKISQKIQKVLIATALASGFVSAGVAASAQTTAAPAPSATNVSMSSVDTKAQRQAHLDAVNAEQRRVAFRNLGTSL